MKSEVKELEKSEVEISIEIPAEQFESFRPKAVQNLSNEVSIDGFRKGHAPEQVLTKKLGDFAVLEEMAELAIRQVYPQLIEEKKLDVVGRPDITITKIAAGNPLEFKARVALMPVFTLSDYKKISKEIFSKIDDLTITDKEVDDAAEAIRKQIVHTMTHQDPATDPNTPLSDDMVKKIGPFDTLEVFRQKLKESLGSEKETKAKESKRIKALEGILETTPITVPEVIISSELEKMLLQFRDDIERMGVAYADYLENIKKTEDDLRSEWRGDAEKRAKIQLVLNKIAETEHIQPTVEQVEQEVEALSRRMNEEPNENMRFYVETVLRNEAVLQFLEGQA